MLIAWIFFSLNTFSHNFHEKSFRSNLEMSFNPRIFSHCRAHVLFIHQDREEKKNE